MIYIQSDSDRKLPHHFDCASALYGAIETAQDYRLTTYEEVKSGKFDNLIKTNLFVGSVEFMREVFSRIGLEDVRVPKNSNREHEDITLDEAHKRVAEGEKLFIKPHEIKLFTGLVLDGCQYSSLSNIPGDTIVMAYKTFDKEIMSEYRVYIKDGEIIDWKNYSGEFYLIPDISYIRGVINLNSDDNFPCCYTIDIGILDIENNRRENVVVEYNDMWAIGNYGLPNDVYLKLLKHRYFEIIK